MRSAAAPIPEEHRPARPLPRASAPPIALLSVRSLFTGVLLSAVVSLILSAWVLLDLGGRRYYATPLALRGSDPVHAILRPSGVAGLTFGILGALCMLVPFVYMLRKRVPWLRNGGFTLKTWLEIHIFCGIVGPVLVTYHTAFKFNGLVSVAYWSMVLVALSGFVGRYLYLRIPRTIRGVELTDTQLAARAADLKDQIGWASPELAERLDTFEAETVMRDVAHPSFAGYVLGGWRLRRRLRILRAEFATAGRSADTPVEEVLALMAERAQLVRRLAYLRMSNSLFHLWHVFHLPLVYVMFAIVSLHVALAVYLGYGSFG